MPPIPADGPLSLPGVTREELWGRLGIISMVDDLLEIATDFYLKKEYDEQRDDSFNERGNYWHTSFHASSFPGDDLKACGRRAMYEMLNIPSPDGPVPAFVSFLGAAGKAAELEMALMFWHAGMLLSAPPGMEQTRFEIQDLWLSGSCDMVILPPGGNKPVPIEVKSKSVEFLRDLQAGKREPEPEHVAQTKTYVGMAHHASGELWPELMPPDMGKLFYFARDDPKRINFEVHIPYDEDFLSIGAARLKEWQTYFKQGMLPQRPKDWRWTMPPCEWCEFKKLCKQDVKDDVAYLSNSNAVEFAKRVNKQYDLDTVIKATRDRWEKEDG